MAFITCNPYTGLLSFTKQATFTPFVMDSMVSMVGMVNINALLFRPCCKWSHAVMDDVIYRTKKRVLVLMMFQPRFQDSIQVCFCLDIPPDLQW